MSELGGQNNAYTSRNETVYYENVAAANLPEILKLEADRMHNLNFSDKEFLNEMNVIREERRQRTEDTADGKMWEQAYLAAFTQPSMRASVIGYMKDLHTLKADDLRAWYKQYYAPNNAVLVIVGDVDAKQTLQTAAKLFGDISAKSPAATQQTPYRTLFAQACYGQSHFSGHTPAADCHQLPCAETPKIRRRNAFCPRRPLRYFGRQRVQPF